MKLTVCSPAEEDRRRLTPGTSYAPSRLSAPGLAAMEKQMRQIMLFVLAVCPSLALGNAASGAVPTAAQLTTLAGAGTNRILGVTRMALPETAVEAYAVKVLGTDGAVRALALDADGNPASPPTLLAAESQAHFAKYGKLQPRLYSQLQAAAADMTLTVHIWAKAQVPYPPKDGLLKDPGALAAHEAEVRTALAATVEPIVVWLNSNSAELLNADNSDSITSPLLVARLPAADLPALAAVDSVAWLDLEVPGRPASAIWYSNTNVASARTVTTASNVRGCVVESDRPANTAYLRVWATASPTGLTDPHAQQVMGIISNSYGGNATSVTNASIAVGNWDQFSYNSTYPSMWAWCNAEGAAVHNFSWVTEDGSDPNFESVDSQIDWYAKNSPYPLIVAAAGNDGNYCENKNRNGLVVGASDDKGTLSTGDDTIYSGSCWRNPGTVHGDLELPNLVAPGVSIDSANLANNTGTSFSTPQVAAEAMLLIGVDGGLAGWPEEMRAVLMATATTNVDGSPLSYLLGSDMKDGAGRIDDYGAVSLASPSNSVGTNNAARANGRSHINMSLANDFTNGVYNGVWNIQAATSGSMRVVAAWDATASCSAPGGLSCSESLDADLDLLVYAPNGTLACASTSYDSSWEACDFAVTAGSTYTAKISQASRNQTDTYFAIAWFNH